MDSEPGPRSHAGILREENMALRQVLGYLVHTLHDSPQLFVPEIGQYIPGTPIKDVLFVSVDVDTGGGYEVICPGQSFHIGISTFDTRSLIQHPHNPRDFIKSYQFINRDDSRPCNWAAKSFLFGETELIELDHLPAKFALLTQDRDYIIVGHGIKEDIKVFNNIDPNLVAGSCYILDTVKAAQHPLHLRYRYSLEKLLIEFNIQHAKLHVGGNDAHFALRVLLKLVVLDSQTRSDSKTVAEGQLVRTLETAVYAPVSLPVGVEKPPPPPKVEKLGLKAKGRLKRARRAARKAFRELPYCDGLDFRDGECTLDDLWPDSPS